MAVGELFVSAFLQVLINRLASRELLQFARQDGLQKHLDKWGKTLTTIQEALDDAEEKQHTQQTVKDWLNDLRDLAYDLEDILDEITTEAALRLKLMGESQARTSKVRNIVPSCFTGLTPSVVKIKCRLESKKITARLNDLVKQKDKLNLKENISPSPNQTRVIPPSTSMVIEDRIYGRKDVAGALLQLLVSQQQSLESEQRSDATKVNVIPILGMGGIGKTTLAQFIYKHKKVQSFFDLKAWPPLVSEDSDVATKAILQSVTSENYDEKDVNWLRVKLREKLLKKRFLVILDDVRDVKRFYYWAKLNAPFQVGAPGSSIVITSTQHVHVSSYFRTIKLQHFWLTPLSDDDCLSIFCQHALDAEDFSAHPNLKNIGEEIVRRCNGLPLAVKIIGCLLRSTQDCKEWENVSKSKIWDIPSETVPALLLSYHNLPSHLKRCFVYCSILPRGYEFEETEVVLLWMAEGLIQPLQEEEEMEDLGSEYFCYLLSRSFFQQSPINKGRFLIHEHVKDFARLLAGDTCFTMEDWVGGSKHIPIKARHLSYLGSQYDVTKLRSLRTFLPLMLPNLDNCFLSHHVPLELVLRLRCLRVLSFNGYMIEELPDSISNLKHLQYIDLSNTQIRSVPESVTTLYNLQTLLLEKCTHLQKLPSKFRNLVNLRHLNIEGDNYLVGMPMQISKLTCLRTLSNLVLGGDNCSGIMELGPLNRLRGTLHISRLENVNEPKDAKDAKLIKKTKISALWFEWSLDINGLKDRTSELEIFNELRPHNALEELVIRCYSGTDFPIWLTPPSFPHMASLTLEKCHKCTSLPPLGQLPSLKILLINDMAHVKNVGLEFCGDDSSQSFKSLESLSFMNMKEWENWSPCEMFPMLHHLSLIRCPKLSGKLPNKHPLLKVEIEDCGQLVVSSVSSFPDQ